MKKFHSELGELLADLNLTGSVPFGKPLENRKEPSEGHRRRFQEILDRQQRFNNRMLLTAITMVVLVFLLGIGVILLYRGNLTAVSVAFGGNLFSLLVTVAWIRRLWIEKGLLDLARLAAEELPPKEAIELASIMYWRVLKK